MRDQLIINYECSSETNGAILTVHRNNVNRGLTVVNTITGDIAKYIYQGLKSGNKSFEPSMSTKDICEFYNDLSLMSRRAR